MSFSHRLAVAALALLPLAATAQQKHQQLNPADANVAVPASAYESAFKSYQAAADEQESPDKVWRDANDAMQSLGGHAGHAKEPATSNPSSASAADAHQDHHGKGK